MRVAILNDRDPATVRELVRFACRDLSPTMRRHLYVEVNDTRTQTWGGNACAVGFHQMHRVERQRVPAGCVWRILVLVGGDERFPRTPALRRRQPGDVRLRDWRDALVWVCAHEGKHCERFSRGIYTNGHAGEEACDAFGDHTLRQFQALELALVEPVHELHERAQV